MVIFGGTDDRAYFSDVVVLDLCSMAWLNPQCSGARPKGRALHASVVFNDFLIVHGGLSIENMECLTGSPKENLYSYGDIVSNAYLNDLRVLDLNTFVWSRLRTHGTPCSPRYGHTAVLSGQHDVIFFGGWSAVKKCPLCNVSTAYQHKMNHTNKCPMRDAAAEGRSEGMDFFMTLNMINQTWGNAETPASTSDNAVSLPSKRYGHSAIPVGNHVVLFGGWDGAKALSEVVVLRDMTDETDITNYARKGN